jgi:hypothetical protein
LNPRIKKVIDDIERTRAKILELQTLLPELERKRIDMENTEIIKLIRSADILPAELPAFLESLKTPQEPAPTPLIPNESGQSAAAEALDTLDCEAVRDDGGDYSGEDGDDFNRPPVQEE